MAVAVAIGQIIIIESDGIEGIGWIFSFVVIAGALFVAFGSPLESSGKSAKSAVEQFTQVLEKMEKKYVRDIKGDPLTTLISKDDSYGHIVPFAFALTVFRKSQSYPGFIVSDERRALYELAANKIVATRLAASKAIHNSLPMPPGLNFTVGPSQQEALAQAGLALNQAVELISEAGMIRQSTEAERNLSAWISQKLKIPLTEGAACLMYI